MGFFDSHHYTGLHSQGSWENTWLVDVRVVSRLQCGDWLVQSKHQLKNKNITKNIRLAVKNKAATFHVFSH